MATTPKLPTSRKDFLAECHAERRILIRKTQSQILAMMEVLEQSESVILDCKAVLTALRSRPENWSAKMSTSAFLFDRPQCMVCGQPVALETSKTDEYGKAVHDHCYLLKMKPVTGDNLPPKAPEL